LNTAKAREKKTERDKSGNDLGIDVTSPVEVADEEVKKVVEGFIDVSC
jgi:hypothetical protein